MKWIKRWASMANDPESPVWEFIAEVIEAQPRALEMIRRNGFVFETQLDKPDGDRSPAELWEKLAFSLYSNLCELTNGAELLLAEAADA